MCRRHQYHLTILKDTYNVPVNPGSSSNLGDQVGLLDEIDSLTRQVATCRKTPFVLVLLDQIDI